MYVSGAEGALTSCQLLNNLAVSSAGNAFGGAVTLLSGGIVSDGLFTYNRASGNAQCAPSSFQCAEYFYLRSVCQVTAVLSISKAGSGRLLVVSS